MNVSDVAFYSIETKRINDAVKIAVINSQMTNRA